MASKAARQIVETIIDEITNRKGLRHQWDNIDVEIQAEIVAACEARTDEVLKQLLEQLFKTETPQ